jgi:hypothetical protein
MSFFQEIADLQSRKCEISMQFGDGSWAVRISHESSSTELLVRDYSFHYDDNHNLENLWNKVHTKFMRAAQNGIALQLEAPK